MEKFKIAGGGEEHEKKVSALRQEGLQPRYGEEKKNPEDLRLIGIANDMLAELSKELDFPFEPIPAERIHITATAAGSKHGEYDSGRHNVAISESTVAETSEQKKLDYDLVMLGKLLHESVHMAGHQKYQITPEGDIDSYRIGYEAVTRGNERKTMLTGFNEAVVDAIVMTCLNKNAERIQKELGVDVSQADKKVLYDYEYHTRMLALIIEKIAQTKGEEVKEVRNRIFKGHFTGEMMHLRDLEKAYGKDALRVFALWGDNESDITIQNEVAKYLKEDSVEKREEIARELLGGSSK